MPSLSPRSTAYSLSNVNLGEDIDLVVGVTAAALTGDQLFKAAGSKEHKAAHLVKAGLGAVVTVGALRMMAREHSEKIKHDEHDKARRHPDDESRHHHPTIIKERPRGKTLSNGHGEHHSHDDEKREVRVIRERLERDRAEIHDPRNSAPELSAGRQSIEIHPHHDRSGGHHHRHRSHSPSPHGRR